MTTPGTREHDIAIAKIWFCFGMLAGSFLTVLFYWSTAP
jgi:hypothetical protein